MFGKDKKMKAKNEGYSLLHIEWKVRAERGEDGLGIVTTIKDSTLSFNPPSLPFLFASLAKDYPEIKKAILLSIDMMNGKASGIPDIKELIKMKLESEK